VASIDASSVTPCQLLRPELSRAYGIASDSSAATQRNDAVTAEGMAADESDATPHALRLRTRCDSARACRTRSDARYSSTRFKRSAFASTETELKVIAAAASMGDSNVPVSG
jgi:hypothetical protein